MIYFLIAKPEDFSATIEAVLEGPSDLNLAELEQEFARSIAPRVIFDRRQFLAEYSDWLVATCGFRRRDELVVANSGDPVRVMVVGLLVRPS